MESMEDIVSVLNELLAAQVLDNGLLERSVNQFNELCEQQTGGKNALPNGMNKAVHQGIVLMDFELHTEEKREEIRLLKLEKVIQQKFELAANMRDEEKECITFLRFKKHYGLEKSTFVIIEGFLIYAYFGNATNDQTIRSYLDQGKWLKTIKVTSIQ